LIKLSERDVAAAKIVLDLIKIFPRYLALQEIKPINPVFTTFFLNKLKGRRDCPQILVDMVAQAYIAGHFSPDQIQTINQIQDQVYYGNFEDISDKEQYQYDPRYETIAGPFIHTPTIGVAKYWEFIPDHFGDPDYRENGRVTLRSRIVSLSLGQQKKVRG